ncbi:TIGR01777 family oxidoreductase [Nonlabens sp.]|uniref:TIGR01777 family oxidoreductase n=1 Tax=Nonlabens sp. TaxID=1888209 RepID=UPI001BCE8F93|nr:TIGR01777 family oxidoreductase [Nonlabens sp.]
MVVLITGATGLVGSKISEDLLSLGHTVHYLTTRKSAIKNESHYKGFLWDVEKAVIDISCIKEVDAIVHLAGETVFQKWTDQAKKRILNSRIHSTELLLRLLKENDHQVKQVVTASAIGIYPDDQNGKALRENEIPPTATNFLAEVCIAWEKAGAKFQDLGLKHAVVRIGIVLSDKGGALGQMATPVKFFAGTGFGNGKMWQSWIAIDDLSGIVVHILKKALEGTYNAVAPNPVRNRPMMELIGKVVAKPLLLPNVPKVIMKLMLGEMSSIVLASQHASSEKIQENGYQFLYPDLEGALKEYLK